MAAAALSFLAPMALLGLLALPALWWLLRATPPQPARALFPPIRLLERLRPAEETPVRTPWWLLALRLALLTALILAFAGPVWRAADPLPLPGEADAPLLVVLESDWASAHDWPLRTQQVQRLVREADRQGRPVALIALPQPVQTAPLPGDAASALALLDTLSPQPVPLDHEAALATVGRTLAAPLWQSAAIVWMTSGLEAPEGWAGRLPEGATLVLGTPPDLALSLDGGADGPAALVHPVRFDEASLAAPRPLPGEGARLVALDGNGRQLAAIPLVTGQGERPGRIAFDLPPDVRNDIARIAVQPTSHAGHVLLVDDRQERRQVAIIGGERTDEAQPLLSASTYIERALTGRADLSVPRTGDGNAEIRRAIADGADVIILASAVSLVPSTVADLEPWMNRGGVLIRFASPGLAASPDTLLPVPLRAVDRQLGGALTWEEPQPIAPFRAASPFAGLAIPEEVRIERQILSEPGAGSAASTYAELADATPLVTGAPRGEGHLVLFHIAADTQWSSLPLSGLFVEMLDRLVALAAAGPGAGDSFAGQADAEQALAPRNTLDGLGNLVPAPAHVEALIVGAGTGLRPTTANPPGFYGPADAALALNLFADAPELRAASPTMIAGAQVQRLAVDVDRSLDLRAPLLVIVVALALADAVIVLALSGAFPRSARTRVAAGVLVGACLALPLADRALAQDAGAANASDAALERTIAAANLTRFAYVVTGNPLIDRRSREGLEGLSRILTQRTAFEPGTPFGVDPLTDELAVYPLLYWPMPDEPMAVPDVLVARIDAFMNNGGTILFDTRDEARTVFSGTLTAQTANLRALLGALDIPPLEPVPGDHVLTKSFYLIDSFPGRFASGPLWVEALPPDDASAGRPARGSDGVSPLMITSNDMASAWALSAEGLPLYATSPPDPVQREFAYRTGVNIAMYVMTGNYKADQVHIPALLERLVQ